MGIFLIGLGCGLGKGFIICGGIIFNGFFGGNVFGGIMCFILKGCEFCVGWFIKGFCGGNVGFCIVWVEVWGGK